MPGRQVERDGRLAEPEPHLISRHHVANRNRVASAPFDQVPVGAAHDNSSLVTVLKVLGAAVVVAVAVTHHNILAVCGVEAQLPKTVYNGGVDRIVVQRIDDDDPVGCRDGPRTMVLRPDEVEIVEDLCRFGIPLLQRRYFAPRTWRVRRRLRIGARIAADGLKQSLMVVAGRGAVRLDRTLAILCGRECRSRVQSRTPPPGILASGDHSSCP